mmetsp:Transcript_85879/g.191139  ORF Transcript_85879/g.191139 Transcript_85879/m.191139 type:complete len:157 (+) Transcript_85879:69-539(+)
MAGGASAVEEAAPVAAEKGEWSPLARIRAAPMAQVRAVLERDAYGRVPTFLQQVVENLEEEEEYIEALPLLEAEADDPEGKHPVRLLTDSERSSLLEGLGARREQVLSGFASEAALHPEEAWKRRVREQYLPQLREIDADIAKLGQRYIFVAAEAG